MRSDNPPHKHSSKPPSKAKVASSSVARALAVDALLAVTKQDLTIDQALHSDKRWQQMQARDRAFCHHLVFNCFRHKGQLQILLSDFLDRPLPQRHAAVMAALLLASCEHFFMRSAKHALVNEYVQLIKSLPKQSALKGLVNAVLRRVIQTDHSQMPTALHNIPLF